MEWQQLIVNIYGHIAVLLEEFLDELTVDDLNKQPHPDCNSMGWFAWHLTRWQDQTIADLMSEEQLWIKDEWYVKFNRPPDPTDTGKGHSSQDVAVFMSPNVGTLLEYHRAVLQRSQSYINSLSALDLTQKLNSARSPTVGARLMGIISDNIQHAGQIAYVRGLLKGKGWLGR